MFTGIVAALGRIVNIKVLGGADSGVRVSIDAGTLGLDDVAIGDSISVQGACMTVLAMNGNAFDVEVSRASLSKTAGLDAPGEVNLEKALSLSTMLGGHLVSGHIDGLGRVVKFAAVGESHELIVRAPRELAKYLAYKGSITVDGVSLTVNRVVDSEDGCEFSVNLIAHTVAVTTLKRLAPGTQVNLEIDLIARYVERMLARP